MKVIRAIIYWLYPQQGAIDTLKAVNKAQEALIQTLRASRHSIQDENDKLWKEIEVTRQNIRNRPT